MAAAAVHGAMRKSRSYGERRKNKAEHANLKWEASFHLKQWLGEDFELPEKVDSVEFLRKAYISNRKRVLLGRDQVPESNFGLKKQNDTSKEPASAEKKNRMICKMEVPVKKLKIEKVNKTDVNGKEDPANRTWKLSDRRSNGHEVERVIILTRSRLFIIMKKINTGMAGDSGEEIIDSIPLHEIHCVKYMTIGEYNETLKDIKGEVADLNKKYLCVFTVDNGFNAGNMFCFKTPTFAEDPNPSFDVKEKIEKAHKKWKGAYEKRKFLQKIQVRRCASNKAYP